MTLNNRIILLLTLSFVFVTNSNAQATKPFAVVELFTSQGCSSCPPADQLLSEISEKADKDNVNILAMSRHIEYWNYLGWEDPYSDPVHSNMQKKYQRNFNQRNIYTPQMLVNGTVGFNGRDRKLATDHIRNALATVPDASISLSIKKLTNQSYTFDILSTDCINDCTVNIAIVEKTIQDKIIKGENRGKHLKHSNVVRNMTVYPHKKSKSTLSTVLAPEIDPKNSFAFAYLQRNDNLAIIAATQAPLIK